MKADILPEKYLKPLVEVFQKNASRAEAVPMEKYMRNQYQYFGLRSEIRIELTKNFLFQYGKPDMELALSCAKYLWGLEQREYLYTALFLMEIVEKKLELEDLPLLEQFVTTKSWWDTVDFIAPHLIGNIFLKYPEYRIQKTDEWLKSGNIWLQRSAILFQLKYKNKLDEELLYSICDRLSLEKEFFIKKAIGWSLREYSKINPVSVEQFIMTHPLQALSIKEGLRRINKKKSN